MPPLVHFRIFLLLPLRWSAALALLVAGGQAAHAQVLISIPNYSFENPSTGFVNTNITSWQKLPQAADFNTNQGFTWAQLAGVFLNDPPPASDNITNMDGNQASYLFGDQGMGLYQTLGTTFQLGQSYHLTVGIVGQGGGMPDGATLQLQLYYLAPDNTTMVTIASNTVTENSTNFPNHTTEFDYSVNLPTVGLFDVWLGRPIGIEIVSPETGADFLGGYWDVDNVRLLSVPEPGSAILLAVGGLALLRRRPRRHA
jgi:hypothetical protein